MNKSIHKVLVNRRGNSKIVEGTVEDLVNHFANNLNGSKPSTLEGLMTNLNNGLKNEQSTIIYEVISN